MTKEKVPVLFNGGMGAKVSIAPLAWEVSSYNLLTPSMDYQTFLQERPTQLIESSHDTVGVVSGVALPLFMARELELGDRGGHLRRAFDHFPNKEMADRIYNKYYIPGGKAPDQPFTDIPMASMRSPRLLNEMTILANFSEVWLAKEGHDGYVGINYLEKIQWYHPAAAFGAMLAGAEYMIVGAGFPRQFPSMLARPSKPPKPDLPSKPGMLEKLAKYEPVKYTLTVEGADADEEHCIFFNPREYIPESIASDLTPPKFVPILAYPRLIQRMVDQYDIKAAIVEGPKAGGHLSPERDEKPFDLSTIAVPVYLAGGYGSPEGLLESIDQHKAAGVSIASILALSKGSGILESLQREVFRRYKKGTLEIIVDPKISPTGFRFRTVQGIGITDPEIAAGREKICDLGFLRHIAQQVITDRETSEKVKKIVYYCPADPVHGEAGCMCNFLSATAGYGQIRKNGAVEQPGVTLGADVSFIDKFIEDPEKDSYTVRQALDYVLSGYKQRLTA